MSDPLPETSTTGKCPPELTLGEDMIERAANVIGDALPHADGQERTDLAEMVLRAAFEGVPIANYAIGTLLQFFNHVICLKNGTAGGVYEATGPESFDALAHSLNYTYRKDGSLSSVQIAKIGQEAEGV